MELCNENNAEDNSELDPVFCELDPVFSELDPVFCELDPVFSELERIGCIQNGDFTLKSGAKSSHYFDMRLLISQPMLLSQIGDMIYYMLGDVDLICAIPHGGMPVAAYISTKYNIPLIFIRDKVKEYGSQKQIEGVFKPTDKCVLIDDVMTSGGSIMDAYNIIRDKVNVVGACVIMDRLETSTEMPIPVRHVFTKNDYIQYQKNR